MRTQAEEAGDRRAGTVSVVLALGFSLLLLPAWLDALARPGSAPWAGPLAGVYGVGAVVAVRLVGTALLAVRLLVCATLLGLGAALVLELGRPTSWLLTLALAVGAVLLPAAVAGAATAITLGVLLVGALPSGDLAEQLENGLVIASVTSAIALAARLVDANARLRRAHDEIATLAVVRERERFARDLHDILGHSLTTIAVKAGLTRRLLETGADPGRALDELADLEDLSRQAVGDLRATVSEYREVTLAAELAGAARALRAAGMDADLPSGVDDVRSDLRETFGYVLREAVTNAVRHSGAGRVTVRLGRAWIVVEDDGAGAAEADQPGHGLRGLEERLLAVGGRLHTGPRAGGGFRLRAEVPVEVAGAGPGAGPAASSGGAGP